MSSFSDVNIAEQQAILDEVQLRRVTEQQAILDDIEVSRVRRRVEHQAILDDIGAGRVGPDWGRISPFDYYVRGRDPPRSRSRSRDRLPADTRRRSSSIDPNVGVGKDCFVCLSEMKRTEDRCLLACSGEHVFHDRCIKRWLRRQDTCPVCREASGGTTLISK